MQKKALGISPGAFLSYRTVRKRTLWPEKRMRNRFRKPGGYCLKGDCLIIESIRLKILGIYSILREVGGN